MSENNIPVTDNLLARYLLQEVSAKERLQVEAWLLEDPANRTHLQQLEKIWQGSNPSDAVPAIDTEAAWQRFRSRIAQPAASVRIMQPTYSWKKIAAIFLVIAGAGLLTFFLLKPNEIQRDIALRSGNSVQADTLPDGSVVTLNKNSLLTYPENFIGAQRVVQLKGEAFFDVKPDPAKPFVITVNDVTVTVVGTSFNVRSENGRTEVIVKTGLVKVERKAQSVFLRPGEKVSTHPGDSILQGAKAEDRLYESYRTREFVCDNTPLWKLVDVLEEAYGVEIVIGRNELRNLPLTTTFSNESLDLILDIIQETFYSYNIVIDTTSKDRIVIR